MSLEIHSSPSYGPSTNSLSEWICNRAVRRAGVYFQTHCKSVDNDTLDRILCNNGRNELNFTIFKCSAILQFIPFTLLAWHESRAATCIINVLIMSLEIHPNPSYGLCKSVWKEWIFSLFLDKFTKVIRRVGVYFQTPNKSVHNQSCFPCYNDHWGKVFAN